MLTEVKQNSMTCACCERIKPKRYRNTHTAICSDCCPKISDVHRIIFLQNGEIEITQPRTKKRGRRSNPPPPFI